MPGPSLPPHLVPRPRSPEHYLDAVHASNPPPLEPEPQDPLAGLSKEDVQLLVQRALRDAVEASRSLPKFFEFVFRAEDLERSRIRTMPHQRLVFDFIRHYRYCVVRLPTNFSKTYCMAADGLNSLGQNPASRGAFISAAEAGAMKPLQAVRSYIESSFELRLVYPGLRPTQRDGEPWTNTDITVDRPYGLRDPSVIARGLDSQALPGARLDWANVDDVLNMENTSTAEQRAKVKKWFKSIVLQRFHHRTGRCPVTNTPWDPDDLTFDLTNPVNKICWPALNMDVWGGIWLENADDFDSDEIRPSRDAAQEEAETGVVKSFRLAAHDSPAYAFFAVPRKPDDSAVDLAAMEGRPSIAEGQSWHDDEEWVPLWPERFETQDLIEECQKLGGPTSPEWARTKLMKPQSEADVRLKDEWVKAAKAAARERGFHFLPTRWDRGGSYTGVDLGFGKGRKSGNCSVFSFAVLPDLRRLLLKVDVFKYPGGKGLLTKVVEHHDMFGSRVAIESNAAQRLMKDFALELDAGLRFTSFETNKNKLDRSFGVESLFLEFENGAWLIPSDKHGRDPSPDTTAWLEDMRRYVRGEHTGDALMASWIARERARLDGALKKGKDFWGLQGASAGVAGITSR